MYIIFQKKGSASIMCPAPKFLASLPESWTDEEKMIHLANKNLPTGTKYEIVDSVPADRTFRNAWEYEAGPNEKESQELDVESKVQYRKGLTEDEAKQYEAIRAAKVAAQKAKVPPSPAPSEILAREKAEAEMEKELENADIN